MNYFPEQWVLIKVPGTKPFYKVFGSWRGGYLNGDSWRLNSGVVRCEESGDSFTFYGESGSEYHCHKNTYGIQYMGLYNIGVLDEFANRGAEVIETLPDVLNMEW